MNNIKDTLNLKPIVVIINGAGGVGKDEFVKQCQSILGISYIYNISTVDKVKECAMILGWDGTKDEKSRKFLSDLKDLSTEYSDHPNKYVIDFVDNVKNFPSVVFVHAREPKQIEYLCSTINNCYSLLITNKNVKHITTNHADANVLKYPYDYHIQNDETIEKLKQKAIDFLYKIGGV